METTRIILLVVIGLLVLVGVGIAAVVITRMNRSGDPLSERLAEYASAQELQGNLEDIEMSVPFTQRVIMPLLQTIANFTMQFTPKEALDKTQRQINLAGNPNGLTPSVFWGMRFFAMFGLGLMMLIVMSIANRGPLWTFGGLAGGSVGGFMLPQLWLGSKITRRQNSVIKALPDALDLMSICVEAGLGFDQAMGKVADKWDNELALAFGRVIREIQLGKTRKEAMRAMADGVDVPDVTTFVGAIIQADQLGVSVARVLKIQAEQMRIKRRQRAQEKAQSAPVKMMIPMVLFIFPTIWIVLLGPAGVQLYKQFFGG